MTQQPRCSCGAYVRPCHKCGRVPGHEQEPNADMFAYRATPQRISRIDRRIAELFAKSRVDRFIEHCVAGGGCEYDY